jgi:hypothetical protein
MSETDALALTSWMEENADEVEYPPPEEISLETALPDVTE